ncbi:MAG: T9SS type A sorting domain-containing protein [Bacteroidales bacterium]|nr:T9SS type A sorting domain-containing protein [Bacteroidales bacterium]
MKKIILFLFSFAVVSTSFAQLTLIHTFNTYDYFLSQGDVGFLHEPINRYVIRSGNTVQIYKPDFSLEKNITITLPNGYTLSSAYVSQHFYNTDNSYEILVSASNSSASDYNSRAYYAIINENGNVLQNFGYAYAMNGGYYRIAGQLRFVLEKTMYNGSITRSAEIYSCLGNYLGIAPTEPSNMLLPYPNPASSIVNLPYEIPQGTTAEMRIFNLDGQLVDVKQLGSHFNNIQLNVDNYTAGIYFYEYNGNKGKFIVQ